MCRTDYIFRDCMCIPLISKLDYYPAKRHISRNAQYVDVNIRTIKIPGSAHILFSLYTASKHRTFLGDNFQLTALLAMVANSPIQSSTRSFLTILFSLLTPPTMLDTIKLVC